MKLIKDLGMLYPSENSKQKRRYGIYECECGNTKKILSASISNGKTSSCGCKENSGRFKNTHGLRNHPLYNIAKGTASRCNNIKSTHYYNYGAKGIKFMFDSIPDYIRYIEEKLGSRPTCNHSIDRIDTNGNYEAGNIRWADRSLQATNKNKRSKHPNIYRNGNSYYVLVNNKYVGSYKDIESAYSGRNNYIILNNLSNKVYEYGV